MSETRSTMLPLGTHAPAFSLPDIDGKPVSLSDFKDSTALLVAFICNHCPYVTHLRAEFVKLAREYQGKGVSVVAICSNDRAQYPDDAPPRLGQVARKNGFTFPYLFDETQETAKAFRAACTPDFYLFDAQRRLVYRGRFDESRPGKDAPPTGKELRAALDALMAGKPPPAVQHPSIGCNIKWKAGNEPKY